MPAERPDLVEIERLLHRTMSTELEISWRFDAIRLLIARVRELEAQLSALKGETVYSKTNQRLRAARVVVESSAFVEGDLVTRLGEKE